MKPVRFLLLALLFGTLSLTACDSGNEKDEDTVVVDTVTQTVTETVVAASAPVVQAINTAVASSFQAIVEPGVVVSTAAGQVIQTSATTSGGTGAAVTTTTTIAPLVTAAGVPTGQVAIVTQSGSTTTIQVAGLTSTNAATPTLGVTSQDGTQTSFPFNATYTAQPAAVVQGNNAAQQKRVVNYNKTVVRYPNLTNDFKFPNGQSAAQRFAAALALPGKKSAPSDLVAAIAQWEAMWFNSINHAETMAAALCGGGGSSVNLSTINGQFNGINVQLEYTCPTGPYVLR
ncbi:hypothetical protein HQ496_14275 [bacterium]|nr:hypothetical protein [bacterium]